MGTITVQQQDGQRIAYDIKRNEMTGAVEVRDKDGEIHQAVPVRGQIIGATYYPMNRWGLI